MSRMRMSLPKIEDYPSHLQQMWQRHLAPRSANSPTVVSTFAGGGGSSLGYSMAGFRELLAVEWDDNAVATFKRNFPGVPVYHGDIRKLTAAEVLDITGLRPGQLDVLDGSPPCQGFSVAGRRQLDDPRNQLFRDFVRLLRGIRPRTFVMENVSGMVRGNMKLLFAEIMQELKASGYVVKTRLLNAKWFGVPQNRERLIFVGVRRDLEIEPVHPGPEWLPVSVREALRGVHNTEADLQPAMLRKTMQIYRVLHGLESPKHFGLVQLKWNRPSNTIIRDAGNSTTATIHPREKRRLTIKEVKRLGSFPDDFVLTGTYKQQWSIIGNSVPPLMMEAIARRIRSMLEHVCNMPLAVEHGET